MSDHPQRTQWTKKKERKFRSTCGVAHTHKERNRSGCLFVSFHSATHHCKGCTRAITSDRGSHSDTHCAVRMFRRSGDSGTNVNIRIGMFFFSVMPILSTFHSCRVRRSIVCYAPLFTWQTQFKDRLHQWTSVAPHPHPPSVTVQPTM